MTLNLCTQCWEEELPLQEDKIDRILRQVLREINGDQSIEKTWYESGENIPERIISLEGILNKKNILIDFNIFNSKCNDKSEYYRKCGNEYYSIPNQNYFKALEFYNKSICWAPNDSANLAYGYANRSAIYFQWMEWAFCLENVALSRSCKDFPSQLDYKLKQRERICIFNINNKKEATKNESNFCELSYPPHKQVPYVADCIELKKTNKYGRGLYTNRDLSIGDVIAIDEPFMTYLEQANLYQRCTYCLSENMYSLIPCKTCTGVMFCSKKCRDIANNEFHNIECNFIDGLFELFIKRKCVINGLRIMAKICSNKEEFNLIKQFVNSGDEDANIFNINNKTRSLSEEYKAVHTLIFHQNKVNYPETLEISISIAIVISFLKKTMQYDKLVGKNRENELFFYKIMNRAMQQSLKNCHNILVNQKLAVIPYSAGIYTLTSMFNHSCVSNIFMNTYQNNKKMFYVGREIKKGEQLFVSYS